MMTLREVSRFFDRVPVHDPATGALLFRGQFSNYDGSRRDAYAAYRRVLSIDPDITLPAGRCVEAMGKVWILGDDHPDGWSELHRRKFVAHRAAGQAEVWSLGSYLAGDPPTLVWADLQWMKDKAEEGYSSAHPELYVAILPEGTHIAEYHVISLDGLTMLVHSSAHHASGFMEARGIVREATHPMTAQLVKRRYMPGPGRYVDEPAQQVNVFHARWQEMFIYRDQLDLRFQEGDAAFALPAAAQPTTSDALVYEGKRYLVQASAPLAGAQIVHARPAA